jgi:Secretion system C-terminal sorting domain
MKKSILFIFILFTYLTLEAQPTACIRTTVSKVGSNYTFSFTIELTSATLGDGIDAYTIAGTINYTGGSTPFSFSSPVVGSPHSPSIGSTPLITIMGASLANILLSSNEVTTTLSATGISASLCNSSISLPVTLLNFQAQPQGKTNLISWQTASEKDNEGFQIQRSAEGKTFKNIGFVKGQGTTNEKQSYSFVDEGPLSISYYRLLQKDFDGKESYSKVVSVVSDSKTHVKIYPNPVADVLNVQINTEKELNTALELYDSAGKMVHTENFNTQKGDNQMSFSTKQLARGFYTLKIKQGDEVVVEKVMIQ